MREYSQHEIMQLGDNLARIQAHFDAKTDDVAGGVLLSGRADKFWYEDSNGRNVVTKTYLVHMDAMFADGYDVVSISFTANRYHIFMREP